MKAPNKIYIDFIDDAICMSSMSDTPNGGIEYIRKDALLEWLEQELAQRQQWLDRYGDSADLHATVELKKVLDKLNSM